MCRRSSPLYEGALHSSCRSVLAPRLLNAERGQLLVELLLFCSAGDSLGWAPVLRLCLRGSCLRRLGGCPIRLGDTTEDRALDGREEAAPLSRRRGVTFHPIAGFHLGRRW